MEEPVRSFKDRTAGWRKERELIGRSLIFGAGDRFRTDDLVLGKHTLYQLSYTRSPWMADIKDLSAARVRVNSGRKEFMSAPYRLNISIKKPTAPFCRSAGLRAGGPQANAWQVSSIKVRPRP